VGGNTSSTSGTKAGTGGNTQANTTAGAGGSNATGGAPNTGANTGGTTANNTKQTGGATAAGGTTKTGGGASSTGTGKATGGSTSGAGGATTAPGGASSKGGASAATGGATTNGGAESTGGKSAGGATNAGGNTGTAGSTGNPPPALSCVTSTNNSWKEDCAVTTATSGTADVTVNDTAAQTWEGFGGAFNELGWTFLTSQTMKDQAMQLLFGTKGAHFNWGRIPMGASDYATSRYTLDDPTGANPTPPSGARPAVDMSKFTITNGHDDKNLIPYIKAAQAVNPNLKFWASPWTPPISLKDKYNANQSGSMTGWKASYFDGGNMVNSASNLTAYADYFKKFVAAYKEEGINIEIVSPQNEPGYEQNYPSCLWDSTTYVAFFKTLGAAMEPLGIKVMLGTMSNNGDTVEGVARKDIDIAKAVLNDSAAKAYVAVAGVQWGVLGQVVTDNGSTFGSGIKVWATEHKCGNYPWESSYNKTQAPNDQAYGVESWGYIRDAINKAKVTSYNAWNMVLDKNGLGIDTSRDWRQDALLVANGGSVSTTQAYYVFRHFSQFVDPGDKVVGTSGGDAVAFKKADGTVVVVMYNSGSTKTYTVKVGSKLLQLSVPGSGWGTLVSPP
jgi:glucosylceramidase